MHQTMCLVSSKCKVSELVYLIQTYTLSHTKLMKKLQHHHVVSSIDEVFVEKLNGLNIVCLCDSR